LITILFFWLCTTYG